MVNCMREIYDLGQVESQQDYLRYSRDVIHNYSSAAKKMINLAIEHIPMTLSSINQGKKVMWCDDIFCLLAYACDYIPLQSADLSRYGEQWFIEEAEKVFQLPAEVCGMVKGTLGGLWAYRNSGANKVVTVGRKCETGFCADAISEKFGYDVYRIENYQRPDSGDYRAKLVDDTYRRELNEIIRFLGVESFDKEKLRSEFFRANRIRDKICLLFEKEKKHRNYYRTIPNFLVYCGAENYFGQPDLFEAIVDEMISEIDSLDEGEYNEVGVPVIWSGLRGVDFSPYNALDIVGGYVAEWNLPTSVSIRFDTTIDPIEELVNQGKKGKRQQTIQMECQIDKDLIKKSNSKGIILFSTLGCTVNTVKTEMKRDYLSKDGVPVLAVNGVPQIGEVTGQLMTRMKAFIEMIA